MAQDVGAYREALTEVAEARRKWHAATELSRQRALMADTELRRRHPDFELQPLHPVEEHDRSGDDAEPAQPTTDVNAAKEAVPLQHQRSERRIDIKAALDAARKAEKMLAERAQQAGRDAERAGDVMRRREAQAQQEANARRTAVRQDRASSRRTMSLELGEPELEAGQ